jgi:hypothetical protein
MPESVTLQCRLQVMPPSPLNSLVYDSRMFMAQVSGVFWNEEVTTMFLIPSDLIHTTSQSLFQNGIFLTQRKRPERFSGP